MTKHFLTVCLCIVTLSACQSTNQSSAPEDRARHPGRVAPAQVGDTEDAALNKRYNSKKDQQLRTLLQRAQRALENNDTNQAAALLAGASVEDRAPMLRNAFLRLSALIYSRQNKPEAALQALLAMQPPQPIDVPTIGQTCLTLGDIQCFVQAQVLLQQLNGKYQQTEQDSLWLELMEAAQTPALMATQNLGTQLRKLGINTAKIEEISTGWLDLQVKVASAGSVTQAQKAWQHWQKKYPEHPATRRPPTPLRQLDTFSPPKISVLLPLSGRLNTVANAIRDGFMAGYFADLYVQREESLAPTHVVFWDSNSASVSDLFDKTVANGSNVIVGPLIKSKASDLLNIRQNVSPSAAGSQPSIVLLNQVATRDVPSENNRHVYQFAAAIEDEAVTLAEHLKAQGYLRLMVVTNSEPWSQRAKKALKDTWSGPLVEANFQQVKEVTDVVGAAMGVTASQLRRDRLAALIAQDLEFLPRARKDLDAVVTFTDSLGSKALVPALKFHFAENLPVFGTSQSARGSDLVDLASFQISELPMLARPTDLTEQMAATFQLSGNPLIELYALGLDAYRLATWTHWLRNNGAVLPENKTLQLRFASGNLTLGMGGRIHRKLQIKTIN